MNTLCVRHPGSIERCAQGWAISFVIHGLAVGLSIALVTSLRMPPDPNAFRWEVALVDAPRSASVAAAAWSEPTSSRSDSKRSETISDALTPPDRRVDVETKQRITPVEQMEIVRTIESAQPTETAQMVHMAQPVSRPEMKTISPLHQETTATSVQPLQQAASVNSLPVHAAEEVVHGTVTIAPSAAAESHAKTSETPLERDQPVISSAPMTRERQVVTQTQPVVSTPHPLIEAKLSRIPDVPPAPDAVESPPQQASGQSKTRRLAFIGPSTPRSSTNNEISGTKDLTWVRGWLQTKFDEALKRPPFRHQDLTKKLIGGLVIVEMHQEQNKMLLDDIQIYEASGHVMIDREVLKRFKAIFPISLEESVHLPRITVTAPYTISCPECKP